MLQLNYQDGSGSLSSIHSSESVEMDEEEKDEDVATSTTTLELRSRANQIRTIFPLIARGIDFIKTHCVRRMHLGLNVSTKIVESRGKCTFCFRDVLLTQSKHTHTPLQSRKICSFLLKVL